LTTFETCKKKKKNVKRRKKRDLKKKRKNVDYIYDPHQQAEQP